MSWIKFYSTLCNKFDKERQSLETESYAYDDYNMSNYEEFCTDERMKDLLHQICQVIDDWTVKYHMEKIPKKIVFERILKFLNTIERNVSNKRF